MQAHIVGGGFGGLVAAAYLIQNAGVPGPDITIYVANVRFVGGVFLGGSAETGFNLPGSVFDSEFRCTFDMLADVPSTGDPAVSVNLGECAPTGAGQRSQGGEPVDRCAGSIMAVHRKENSPC